MNRRETWVAYVLLIIGGIFGVHKFYLGKWGWGLAYFFTGGFFLIGCLIDLFTLPMQVRLYNIDNGAEPPPLAPLRCRRQGPVASGAGRNPVREQTLVEAERRIQRFAQRLDHLEAAIDARRY